MHLDKSELAKIIRQEVKKLVDEEILVKPPQKPGDHMYAKFTDLSRLEPQHKEKFDCPKCGTLHHDDESCPSEIDSYVQMIYESCGCGGASEHAGMDDYSLDYVKDTGAFDLDALLRTSMPGYRHDKKHHDNAYMAKPQLRKIAKYAQELYDMLPEDYNMTDWQRSHLSSIADDISEVYHSLEHKLYKGEI